MIRYVILLTVLFSIVSADYATHSMRIIGGSNADDGQFPYIVSVRVDDEFVCAGSIINNKWVLTSALCALSDNKNAMSIVAGINKLSNAGDSYKIEEVIYHENFDPQRLFNDIALIKIDGEITFNDKVKPIDLNTKEIDAGETLVFSGWGRTVKKGSNSDDLQFINLESISTDDCKKRSAFGINQSQICTLPEKGKGICRGDFGGPLVYQGNLAGVASWGHACVNSDNPDIFSRVTSYSKWINEKMN